MLSVESLTKIYGNPGDKMVGGIREADLTVPAGTFFTLLGPSGCGKTTTLRCVAGLETPDAGRVRLHEHTLFDAAAGTNRPIERRNVGMVFQSYAIWPHMTVAENVGFPLTVAKDRSFSRAEIRKAVSRALSIVSLDGYEDRSATQLSGGQQQRVALARAIVRAPALLLLDEPLSNLDAQLREEMRTELSNLQRTLGLTTIYVTHDQSEALALSHLIAVINKGRIVQIATPRDIYYRPANAFVARFVGATNLLPGRLLGTNNGVQQAEILNGRRIGCVTANITESDTAALMLSIRPETVVIGRANGRTPTGLNRIEGRVIDVTFLGQRCRVDIIADDTLIQVMAPGDVDLPADALVTLSFSPDDAVAVPADRSASASAPEKNRTPEAA